MDSYNLVAGNRLRQVRSIFNEGSKLSGHQLAYILDETNDKLISYELGRASIPIRILFNLYQRGYNPNYIITGEGGIFADNEAGARLKSNLIQKMNIGKLNVDVLLFDESINNFKFLNDNPDLFSMNDFKAAAGKIK